MVPTDSDGGSLNAINAVPVDQYVKGVIPNESPASWPLAALRAQAVAARSYALSVQVGGNGFDLYDDTSSQVYKGLESETARSNEAAEDTRSQVVEYQGKIAQTYFSACSGGHTESVQNVFFGPADPLPGRRPRPLRLLLPAAQLDAAVQRAGDQRQARRLPRRPPRSRSSSPSTAPPRASSGPASTAPAA